MRFSKLTSFLVAAALTAAPMSVAFAQPTFAALVDPAPTIPAPAPVPVADTDLYAAREAKDTDVQKFRGGEREVVIGLGTLLLIALILVVVF